MATSAAERVERESTSDRLVFNGIDGATGGYLLPPLTVRDVAALARGDRPEAGHLAALKGRHLRRTQSAYRPMEDVDPKDLAQAGWGVVFAQGADPQIRAALGELLEHRQAQAAKADERLYREDLTYEPDQSASDFLDAYGAGPGPAVPRDLPYYLLLVGSPEDIPYHVQYQIDVQRAVGRIHFETPDEYARYARSVVASETGPPLARQAAFFGVRNADDLATTLSADDLVRPLAEALAAKQAGASEGRETDARWTMDTVVGEGEATKARLATLLGGPRTPALLFTASHGMGFPSGHPLQARHQGALLCQDWPGPEDWQEAIPADFYLSADDVHDDARLLGLIAFHFACFGSGTPRLDDFAHHDPGGSAGQIAPRAFVAPLARRLLGHPAGGALAVVGHVERAWGYSFQWKGSGRQIEVFRSTLRRLMLGHPVGSAVEFFNDRYAELSTLLTNQLNLAKQQRKRLDDGDLAGMWTANNDARSYAIVGDPAVRLRVGDEAEVPQERSRIEAVTTRFAPLLPTSERAERAIVDRGERSAAPVGSGTAGASRARGSAPASGSPSTASSPSRVPADVVAAAVSAAVTAALAAETTSPPAAGRVAPEEQAYFRFWGGDDGDTGSDGADGPGDGLGASLRDLVRQLGELVTKAATDAGELVVSTYVTDDMTAVANPAQPDGDGVRLRALTRIKLDGDVVVYVPETRGEVDAALWAIHADMVTRAQAGRADLLRTVASMASGLAATDMPW